MIEIRAIKRNPRAGWAEDARRVAQDEEGTLVWPEFPNQGDEGLVW